MFFLSWSPFAQATAVAWIGLIVLSGAVKGRLFATFAAIMFGVHALISVALWPTFEALGPVAAMVAVWLQAATVLHYASLNFPQLRSGPWRSLISWPGLWWGAASFLAFPWALAASVDWTPHALWLPYLVGLLGLAQSLRSRSDTLDLVLDGEPVEALGRQVHGKARSVRPLRIVQITDPHLGPFMSVERLRGVAKRAAEANPDLVLLTGDYLTMESQGTPGCLAEALEPLRGLAAEGKVYACRGNHDLEAPEMVADELAAIGIRLLIDEAVVVETEFGPVQIVGMDFRWRGRESHGLEIAERWPRVAGALRIVLLHDPGAFASIPDGYGDLVLSGHTHGGQVGLVSLGLPWTAVSLLSSVPDHGYWALGRNRLYVNRAAGHYGFPLRVGVPSEEGVLQIHAGAAVV